MLFYVRKNVKALKINAIIIELFFGLLMQELRQFDLAKSPVTFLTP